MERRGGPDRDGLRTALVTDPIRDTVTPVQDIDLSFPGHTVTQNQTTSTGITVPMTANEIQTICNANPVNVAAERGVSVVGRGFTLRRPSSFALRVCGPTGPCRTRTVTGSLPPRRIRRASARLTRAGHTYGRGPTPAGTRSPPEPSLAARHVPADTDPTDTAGRPQGAARVRSDPAHHRQLTKIGCSGNIVRQQRRDRRC